MSLSKIHEIAATLENEYVRKWKSEGNAVVGHACIAMPKEMAEAGKILPFREVREMLILPQRTPTSPDTTAAYAEAASNSSLTGATISLTDL